MKLDEEINDLLKDIQEWMIENDYECGEVGSEIYGRITKILTEEL